MFRLNTFSTIPDCTISVIDASYCKIRGKLTINAHQITSLDLSHCGLFGHISFPPLPLLDSLNLSNNSISSISFESSRRLTMLNLSYNAISEFPSFLFRFPMLRHLEISHNVIPGIPRDLSPLKRLEILDISHNQLITPRLLLPIKLQTLIASFNYSMAFEAFPSSLKHIDVSFCSTVVIPPISPSIEWIAVFFVSAIYINEKMKPLNDETHQKTADGMQSDLETALAPASLFRPSRVFRTNTNFLNIPTLINDKLSDHIGCSATSGHSTKYEDNFMSITIDDISYIGVFDGHAGHESAYISAETFSKLLGPIVGTVFDEDTHIVKKAMKRSFAMVNDELSRRAVKDGTTAVVMAVKGHRVVIGHVGDSLALLVRSNSAEWLTSPHRPYELIEYNRMKDQQKAVTPDWRVDGKLCVSRSLGDFWCCDGMYDKPDVEVKELPNDVVSVVMACDGLWDYIDIGAVANVVRKIKDPVKAAKLLQDYAFAAGSHDSISVIVVNFTDDI
ncbi:leucine rich repeat / protein phosphatase 2C domain containing protein [Histomonas meleagridis]|uniref:leucine rich repeat / protein phosphatase 2C domain containing protein n=1 Tax=Histomonas meleagridis TaxID=135588 RepID=UPI00355A67DC|nr:leucine rich repeat / protein phosphatase 2C domain containing protein [Histomonas meleagridis]KAH0798620.1 leucine rich repeat / protein phosphatase 2C domain containing protein [Histomonas meleagridis]